MGNVVVVGAQWGDEGKGKITDLLAEHAHVVVRYGGGNNAGHTVIVGDRTLKLHLVPSGILYPDTWCLIGNGTVVDLAALLDEMAELEAQGLSMARLRVSELAHVIMPYHRALDRAEEARRKTPIGTTGRGIGPAYGDKVLRYGFRLVDLRDPDRFRTRLEEALARANEVLVNLHGQAPLELEPVFAEMQQLAGRLAPHVTDTGRLLHDWVRAGKIVLFEGAQGALLDIDQGTYPFVTSSYPVAGGACIGSGVGPGAIDQVLGIAKAYTTRVGGGPFPSELLDATGDRLREVGHEFGTTTGRPRRCGWFDAVACRLAARINGLDALCITKLDVLDAFDEVRIVTGYRDGEAMLSDFPHDPAVLERCVPVYETMQGWKSPTSEARRWEDLPAPARAFLKRLEGLTGVPISMISVGAEREATLILDDPMVAPRRA